jgi:hypothetical protein
MNNGESDTEEEVVRTWAQKMVENGIKQKGKGYHVNLLAQRKTISKV